MPKPKVSLLLFCHDDQAGIANVLHNLAHHFDDILIVDSSEDAGELKKVTKRYKGIRIYRVVSLGLRDPFEPWAIGKCRHEWVLQIDADELVNKELLLDLDKICAGGAAGYAIRRWENSKKSYSTWQTRLFRKGHVTFSGLPHRHAEIRGRVGLLPVSKYCMYHIDRYRSKETGAEYTKLLIFERFSENIKRSLGLAVLSKNFLAIPSIVRTNLAYRGAVPAELRRILNKEGVVKFLGFDKKGAVEAFVKRFENKKDRPKDADLLIYLVLEKYMKMRKTKGGARWDSETALGKGT